MSALFDFTHAIVRRPGASVSSGIRADDGPDPRPDGVEAEHAAYVGALCDAGLTVELLDPLETFPDSVFVEDVALVFGDGAILLRARAEGRRGEALYIAPVLKRCFDDVLDLGGDGFVDGGDVLVLRDRVVIGLSQRTDRSGAEALVELLARLGRKGVVTQTPPSVLHFKTGCSLIDEETVLIVPALANCAEFAGMRIITTPPDEAAAANLLRVRDRILIGDSFPRTRAMIEELGVVTIPLPVAEIGKIDAGLSCMSLRWKKAA